MAESAVVCGGGVGGLAAGLALERSGFEVSVLERHPELRTAGVGLNLWPNGVRAIYELGLANEFAQIANVVHSYRTFLSDGTLVSDDDVGSYQERYGAPVAGIFRHDLSVLLSAALGSGTLRFGHEVIEVEDLGDHVECRLSDHTTISGDFLVAADGIYSRVRTHLFGPCKFRNDHHVRWRGVFEVADAGVDHSVQTDVIGEDSHFGWVAIGKGRAYWYAAGDHLDDKPTALAHFGSWVNTPVPHVVDATPDETIIRNELMDFDQPLERWGRGRITLLGDAAHPMLPGVAQGANQTLEDAMVLAEQLSSHSDAQDALRAYEAARIDKATQVALMSRSLFEYDKKVGELHEINRSPIVYRYVNAVEGVPSV